MTDTQKDKLAYGFDPASPDGDKSALAIKVGKNVYSFVGEEAEAIEAYVNDKQNEALVEGVKLMRQAVETFMSTYQDKVTSIAAPKEKS